MRSVPFYVYGDRFRVVHYRAIWKEAPPPQLPGESDSKGAPMMAEMKAASTRGKKFNQKIKPYVVLQYLLKYTDVDNIVTAPEIVDFLEEHSIEA